MSRPSLSRWERSASWERTASTTKKMARPSLGRTVDSLIVVTSVPPARTNAASRAVEDLAADHVERNVDFPGSFQFVGLQVQEALCSQAEDGVAIN